MRGGLLKPERFFCVKCGERLDDGTGADSRDAKLRERLLMHVWLTHPEYIVEGKLVGPS